MYFGLQNPNLNPKILLQHLRTSTKPPYRALANWWHDMTLLESRASDGLAAYLVCQTCINCWLSIMVNNFRFSKIKYSCSLCFILFKILSMLPYYSLYQLITSILISKSPFLYINLVGTHQCVLVHPYSKLHQIQQSKCRACAITGSANCFRISFAVLCNW